jgi:hypothetical protein
MGCVGGGGNEVRAGWGRSWVPAWVGSVLVAAALGAAPVLALASALPQQVLFVHGGLTPGDRAGAALARCPDLDGDGTADLALGMPRAQAGDLRPGAVQVVSGATGQVLWQRFGAGDGEGFGTALAAVGDLDGDGVADLAVGAPAGGGGRGAVQVCSGRDGSALVTWTGGAPGDRFGAALAAFAPAESVGPGDLAVGAPQVDGSGANTGQVSVIALATGAVRWSVGGAAAFDQLGASLAALGDPVVGAELVIGVPFDDGLAFNGGAVQVRSAADGSLRLTVHGDEIGALLGSTVRCAGDVDGDGRADFVVCAPGADLGGLDAGAALVHSGSDGALLRTIVGQSVGEYLGAAVGIGDLDGDGRGEIAVGAASAAGEAGRVRVVAGADGAELSQVDGAAPFGWFGAALEALGDVNGDGALDFAVGAPGHDDHLEVTGRAVILSGVALALVSDGHAVSLASGGVQGLLLDFGAAAAGRAHLVLGSFSGIAPGLAIGGSTVPLVADEYTSWLLSSGGGTIQGAFGVLDAAGMAQAMVGVPANLGPSFVGLVIHHAALALDPSGAAPVLCSAAVPLVFEP